MDFMLQKKRGNFFFYWGPSFLHPFLSSSCLANILRGVESAEAFLDFPFSSIVIGEPRLSSQILRADPWINVRTLWCNHWFSCPAPSHDH